MQGGRDYIIQFAGLKPGEHEYKFDVGNRFFEDLDYSEIKQGDIHITLSLLKQSTMMIIHFDISGTVGVDCDRCGHPLNLPVKGNNKLIVKVGGHESGDEDDDIITIAANEHELDLSQYIYEYVSLSLPIRRVHPEEGDKENICDPETLKKLNDLVINKEDDDDDNTDPRWEGLRGIKLN